MVQLFQSIFQGWGFWGRAVGVAWGTCSTVSLQQSEEGRSKLPQKTQRSATGHTQNQDSPGLGLRVLRPTPWTGSEAHRAVPEVEGQGWLFGEDGEIGLTLRRKLKLGP